MSVLRAPTAASLGTLVALAALLALAAFVPAATAQVYLTPSVASAESDYVRPRVIQFYVDGAEGLMDLRWASWGGRTATAAGTYVYRVWDTTSHGQTKRFPEFQAHVTVSGIRRCRGRLHYTSIAIRYNTNGHMRRRIRKLWC